MHILELVSLLTLPSSSSNADERESSQELIKALNLVYSMLEYLLSLLMQMRPCSDSLLTNRLAILPMTITKEIILSSLNLLFSLESPDSI